MNTPKDWTRDIVGRFKDGETVAELAIEFDRTARQIEAIIRLAMQHQEEDF